MSFDEQNRQSKTTCCRVPCLRLVDMFDSMGKTCLRGVSMAPSRYRNCSSRLIRRMVGSTAFRRVRQSTPPSSFHVYGAEPAAPEDSQTRLKAVLQTKDSQIRLKAVLQTGGRLRRAISNDTPGSNQSSSADGRSGPLSGPEPPLLPRPDIPPHTS
jgi:hypothetical protein